MAKRTTQQIGITKATIDILLKEKKSVGAMALYLFYCYTATWQSSNPTKCTVSYAAEGLKISTRLVQKYKKQLIKLGLIEDIRKPRKGGGWYFFIKVNYLKSTLSVNSGTLSKSVPLQISSLSEIDPQIHVTNKTNTKETNKSATSQAKVVDTLLTEEELKNTWYSKSGCKLCKIVKNSKNPPKKSVRAKTWAKELLELKNKDKHTEKEIIQIIDWLNQHYNDKYTPRIWKASHLRERWHQIVDAKNRRSEDIPEPIKQTATVKRVVNHLKAKEWRRFEPDALLKAVVISLENYKTYKRAHKKLLKSMKNHRPLDRFVRKIDKEFIFKNEDFVYHWFDEVRKELEDWKEWRGSFKQYVFDITKDRFKNQIMQLEQDSHNECGTYSTQYFKNLEEMK